ncbi:MAG: GTP-binding protein TypA [Candidatus Yanofskybacteria bacterium RIFCSPHIGHO2_01_FULL_45_42]|uniref:50S ribosomal subunit assembly factor BipA n=3 Tax=Candidatus Yanofskyibacteriota TaxID=1752733 RepID=A0A1F8H2U2_9BACT|nr:MAG: GTP-binding protein TypA [Candidatus Yanofskybacteria bacterium RIFCSPHIGHO2_01_FULL_45_42]OGN15512.1 MAG: GTP-binding protein TypA [Candidatus Yanofskybacteria bacterium RIFCSPHIGHO2_02_FULL_46_19]OGN27219.1 MAG: GTP-binding protein TypA [Candidatus Yanofskybacteria bacterium RIFCSPLOWO2_01_FULL_45_72]OGN31881.1 MAG: GTP-binding protein TypA [Candidatus Yanofskybacteria bacterium RIFCSPLOWO2_02_FULL_45_18]
MQIRNIAIIAHVDHGKTTLTDALMKQTGTVGEDFSMDTNALEKERGITIYAKNASLMYKDTKINIVDTPGHADFGSEVERVLRSIDSVLLVVDAQEGPMPQTKFVLKKSLELGLKPIVIINKIDKPAAKPEETHEKVLELFMDLGANDEQLDFKVVYTIGKQGIAKINLGDDSRDLAPLLDTILEEVRPAAADTLASFRFQPFNLGYDNFLGRLGIGRIYFGSVREGDNVFVKKADGETHSGKVAKIFTFHGTERREIPEAFAGDIVMIAGLPDIYIGDTVCTSADAELLAAIKIDEPTISLNFLVNDSPFAGRDGKFVTTRQLKERLERELEVNVGLKVDFSSNEFYKVCGRGELHIAILLENMRREGYELQVSQPQVITKEIDGVKMEPFEEAIVDLPENLSGVVIQKLSKRAGKMMKMEQHHGEMRLTFEIPTRGLLGFRNEFTIDTRGEGILANHFIGFRPWAGDIKRKDVGSMVSMETGKALGFSLYNLQDRGKLYIAPNTEVYEGMVIGDASKGHDMAVNPIKGKKLTNMRAAGSDENIVLAPPFEVSLERGLEIMNHDEYLEVTPKNIRLRKKYLTSMSREKAKKAGLI